MDALNEKQAELKAVLDRLQLLNDDLDLKKTKLAVSAFLAYDQTSGNEYLLLCEYVCFITRSADNKLNNSRN